MSRMTPTINKTGVYNDRGRQVLKIQFVSQPIAKTAAVIARPDNKAKEASKTISVLTYKVCYFHVLKQCQPRGSEPHHRAGLERANMKSDSKQRTRRESV